MKYINVLFLIMQKVSCINLYQNILHKPKISNMIYMSNNIPEYQPLQVINSLTKSTASMGKWNINELINEIDNKHIDSLTLLKSNNEITGIVAIDDDYYDKLPLLSNLHYIETGVDKISEIILNKIVEKNIYYDIITIIDNNLIQNLPVIIFNILCIYFFISLLSSVFSRFGGNMPSNMGNFMNQNKKLSAVVDSNDIDTRFIDIAGCDEAKYELEEVVDFLKNPDTYNNFGAKIPKGVLLEGPPGTGKTLLARAVAGEANVGFISVSASEFIQMFVGVGAARVRDLFDEAKKNSPCVIFIDELDAIGRKRGEGFNGGGNEEREQTLNQILTKMDGFDKSDAIVVLAATNRIDILDTALTRSGRFDRKVKVGLPDIKGRRAILDIHLRNKNVNSNTDFEQIASLTSGFSGADIENMANEAIILALRNNSTEITTKYLLDAFEKITIGLPLSNQIINVEKDQLVAYHEAGHTLTALLFKDIFTVRKVTINANTNGAGGYTLFTPLEKYMQYPTKKYFLANMIVAMGGRAAEIVLYNNISNEIVENNYKNDLIFGDIEDLSITAGASQDLKQIDRLARQYIELFGIDGNNNIEYPIIQSPNNGYTMLSDKTNRDIEKYVVKLTNMALKQAINIILSNYGSFVMIADELIKKREIDELYLSNIDVNYY
jgi:cell division protease FtsH